MALNLDTQRVPRFYLGGMTVGPSYLHQFSTVEEMTGVCQLNSSAKPSIESDVKRSKLWSVGIIGWSSRSLNSRNVICADILTFIFTCGRPSGRTDLGLISHGF